MKGYMDAFADHGITFDEKSQYEPSRFSMAGGYESTQKLLKKNPELTAIFAIGDTIAIGAMRAIRDMGLSIPEDISVIGFDGLELGEYVRPKLSTVEQDVELLAKRSCKLLRDYIEDRGTAKHEMVGFSLKCRQSVKYLG
jgi:LacI family transcriptional regulator